MNYEKIIGCKQRIHCFGCRHDLSFQQKVIDASVDKPKLGFKCPFNVPDDITLEEAKLIKTENKLIKKKKKGCGCKKLGTKLGT